MRVSNEISKKLKVPYPRTCPVHGLSCIHSEDQPEIESITIEEILEYLSRKLEKASASNRIEGGKEALWQAEVLGDILLEMRSEEDGGKS